MEYKKLFPDEIAKDGAPKFISPTTFGVEFMSDTAGT